MLQKQVGLIARPISETTIRNQKLDILRTVAVLLVLGRHLQAPYSWYPIGWIGVDLFFVLSGFLISGLLFAEYRATGDIGWKRFFIRRGFKIYPAYYALIAATLFLQFLQRQRIQWLLYVREFFMVQNYFYPHIWPHTWSLAVEEHFYILLPLLLLLLSRVWPGKSDAQPFRMIPYVCLLIAAFCLLLRYRAAAQLVDPNHNWAFILFPSHLRFDSLFFGVLLGYLHHFHLPEVTRIMARTPVRILLLLVSLLLIAPSLVLRLGSPFLLSFGLTTLYLGFGGILALSLYGWRADGARSRFPRLGIAALAAYIGRYSYSIYLWHGMVGQHEQGFFRLFWPGITDAWLFGLSIVLQLAVGILLSLAIEWPMLHLRDRWFPSLQPTRPKPQPVGSRAP